MKKGYYVASEMPRAKARGHKRASSPGPLSRRGEARKWPGYVAFFLFVFFMAGIVFSRPSPKDLTLDVILFDGNSAYLGSPANFTISGKPIPPGDYQISALNGNLSLQGENLGKSAVVASPSPAAYLTFNHSPYRGIFIVSIADGKLKVTNRLPLEEYLYGVIPKEMPGSELEALKAQAVASRTLALQILSLGKPIRPTVSQQVYAGVESEREAATQAVLETQGLVLSYHGSLVSSPLFSSTCGGKTESSRDAFGKPLPYLTAVDDSNEEGQPYCTISPYYRWTVSWTVPELMENFSRYGMHGEILEILPVSVDPNGHVKKLKVRTKEGTWLFRGLTIREILKQPDGKLLDSTHFTISKEEENGECRWTAQGYGKGHGVGLCQWGAIGMAREGKDFSQILAHYYAGTEIHDISAVLGYNRGRGEVIGHLPLEKGSAGRLHAPTSAGIPGLGHFPGP